MRATDLRVGNFAIANNVKYRPDDVGKVVCIVGVDSLRNFKDHESTANIYLLDDVFKDTYGTWVVYLEPIPLTAEWLLKLGFEYIKGDNAYHTYASPEHDYYLQNDARRNNGEYVILDNSLEDLRDFALIPIRYIHQLQNIYFALTDRELKI